MVRLIDVSAFVKYFIEWRIIDCVILENSHYLDGFMLLKPDLAYEM